MTRLESRRTTRPAQAAKGNPESKRSLDAVERLLFLAVVFMPFQQALTISVGFPLKITEICIILALGFTLITPAKVTRDVFGRPFVLILGALTLIATLWAFLFKEPVVARAFGYNLGFTNDMLLYCGYAMLALAAWWVLTSRLALGEIERAISIAIRLAAIFCAIQLAAHFAGAPLPTFLNAAVQNGATFGISLPRNGPFLEGNYLGFFSGIALFACLRRADRFGAALAIGCLIYSQSTSALLAAIAAGVLTATLRPQRGVGIQVFSAMALVALAALVVPTFQRFLVAQLSKLGFGGAAVDVGSRSLQARSQSSTTGFTMAFDNPLFGVGPGRFGLWKSDYSQAVSGLNAIRSSRGLANNAYAQLAAETGLIALAVFGLFLLVLVVRGFTRSGLALGLGVYLAVALASAPSWTALTVWIAIAYAAGIAAEPRTRPAVPGDSPTPVVATRTRPMIRGSRS